MVTAQRQRGCVTCPQRPSKAPAGGLYANVRARLERICAFSSVALPVATSLVLEGLGGVVPRLAAIDLEAATDLRITVDADDLVALGALPALEAVRRALERHARAALVAHLALQGRGAGSCVAREVSAHVVVSLLLPPSPGGHHQHGPTLAILHPSLRNFRMPISSPLVLRPTSAGSVRSSSCPHSIQLPPNVLRKREKAKPAPTGRRFRGGRRLR